MPGCFVAPTLEQRRISLHCVRDDCLSNGSGRLADVAMAEPANGSIFFLWFYGDGGAAGGDAGGGGGGGDAEANTSG